MAAAFASLLAPAAASALKGAELERLAAGRASATGAAPWAYADPAGDNATLGPDLTDVAVDNDSGGRVSVRIDVPNVPALRAGHFFALFLDTDGRRTTGSPAALGADYAIAFDGLTGTTDLARWTGGEWSFAVASTSLRATWSNGASVSVHRNELGATSGFNFWAGASWTSEKGALYGDVAPDADTWSYALHGLDATSSEGPRLDATPPRVRALPSMGRSGRAVRLRYRASDETGDTRERIHILRSGRVVAVLATRFAPNARRASTSVGWLAPRTGRYRFCVEAWDRAGNASGPSCARLTVRGR